MRITDDTLPPEDEERGEPAAATPVSDDVGSDDTLPPEEAEEAVPPATDPPVASDVEIDETLPPGDAVGVAPSTAGPPVASWNQYEVLELLGKGGMGEVYKARDHHLDRTIAIKFLRGADPNLRMRFVQEARAQSRINHPNVCRVYEANEVQGHAYIALQFVDGEPLHRAAARMSIDEKIAVVRDVAVAIQEAHRLGIVHRDLKPANVMVERTEDGRWFPIVMDFGLAREATVEAGITASGALLGTPAYMSPEQARGDGHAVDRRSDVYSLGATLYELLTGRPPFPATSLATALALVIHDDPPAPRSLVPSLPIDLETIALKCLAKDPTRRYPSARALADDLGRYLDGEPILGRRLPVWQRVRLRARRHRALVTLGASSLAIIIAVAALGVRTWIVAGERARLAERLGREATEIVGHLREAYQWPLHDTRRDRQAVRERMRAIAATDHGLGELGDAAVHNALGRGHLALHEWGEADAELAQAVAAGLQTPELHAARGRALGELYHRALEEARRSGDQAWRARRQQELAQQYLTPALVELEQSRASGEDAALLQALIALYRRDFATAEQLARAVAEREPGSSEARKLAADAAYGAAIEAFDHGEYDAARQGLERATTLYADASEVARSDASAYQAEAEAWLQIAEIDFNQSASPREPLEHALDLIDLALRADPDDAPAYTTKAYVLLRWYRTPALAGQGDQKLRLIDRIAQAATRAVEIDPLDAHAWTSLGNAHVYRGIHALDHRGEGAPWWNRALGELGLALMIQPDDPRANNDLGMAHRWLANDLDRAGKDPLPEYQAALRSYERAAAIDPQYVTACANQADLYTLIAEHDDAKDRDPQHEVDDARRVGDRCLEIDPNYFFTLEDLARAQLALAHHLVETSRAPTAALAVAGYYLDRDARVHPGYIGLWYYRLVAAGIEATFRLKDADPMSWVEAGRAALKQALQLNPDSAVSYVEAARLDLVEAAWAARSKHGSAARLAEARAAAEQAIVLDPQLADAKLMAAKACLEIAKLEPSRAVISAGVGYVQEALVLNWHPLEAERVRDALSRLRAP